ncbi:hypothetical protein TCAL_03319 [Tigriopus californicus]|uniref:Cytochrome c oxidase subunit 5A, mitochondrial n=1 Tax=Tigriopus californicus TaxID=6832 RepID=A0A553NNL5_TIGCA|nr:cytochrome c oxidase subunit 5A, mitochondrial-like [Tigriopus californicus]TRY67015.1 hypothetical protein TCAL_03319 [Tigriopus californicus]|eukprot:TCALIF_03319-PA protein Name:"Similar to CoVa Cytochrome c oxidase subunit 5A, mitochondrial (Drosophila melanogaster)" AED:0.07 eAED:0.07 QI:189/1/1/1/0.5/0.33/3/188/154
MASSSMKMALWTRNALIRGVRPQMQTAAGIRFMSSKVQETDAEFDARYEAFFNRKDIDGWEIRKAMQDLARMDLVPEPTIVAAALRACRRVNDYSLTTRFLEVVKFKCGSKQDEIWPYMLQEIRPTLDELGISTPEELGYDKPELALPNPYEIH